MSDFGTPLYDALVRHTVKGRASFHTPGHKGQAGVLRSRALMELDLTELPDTASLFDGGDAIEQAEWLAAAAFGAGLTLFSAGGCTLCIQTMLLLGAGAGARVLMARNAHRSAVHAAALLGLNPVWAWPSGSNGQITPGDIAAGLEAHPDVTAVYLTSPDYYGNLADIPAVAALCRQAGVKLLVDNAHGSHLGAFGRHPLALGADMTADSAHKTLPVLTGGALLHIGRADEPLTIDRQTAKAAMALFGSTSPAFPVLASLDLARDWWQRAGAEAYQLTAETVAELEAAARLGGIGVGTGDTPLALRDPARLTLDTAAIGVAGTEAAAWMREQGCEPEYADRRYVVFIVTPFNTPDDIRRLRAAITALPAALRRGRFLKRSPNGLALRERVQSTLGSLFGEHRPPVAAYDYTLIRPAAAMSPRDALLSPMETVDAVQAAGRVCARAVCPCPPGIAAVVPGELIDDITAEQLAACGFTKLDVVK